MRQLEVAIDLLADEVDWGIEGLVPAPPTDLLVFSDDELVVELSAQAESHQLVAAMAIEKLRVTMDELERLREQHRALVEEYRCFRAAMLGGASS